MDPSLGTGWILLLLVLIMVWTKTAINVAPIITITLLVKMFLEQMLQLLFLQVMIVETLLLLDIP